ncbi:CoA transferase subunit A [Methylobacterium brachythecii]|uniref:CoA-transferase n=1 Tax=Methylobacterium brachythecii TaxID=1176177 RepID=A0A7W6AHY7_9HYPH|nr:CoA-transferase [Methylobacterium brachythecii]MBB3901291.1 glutaconate CoA-transferase subunit A [Methylobacterium brachythecii]GLS45668.1 CoA-transferase [Methylobacterium brachythecii]
MSSGTSKIVPLADLAARITDGSSMALGGSFLHRGPFALVRELIRQGRKELEVIKQSPGYDIDILCRAGALARARAGIVAMEGNFGLAPWYRKTVEKGEIRLEEHACATLTAGLRASAFGVPFMPCGGIHGSDLPALNGWRQIEDPYGTGESVYAIPKITPDFAVILANEVSEEGDVRVYGTSHWDRIMSRSAKRVLIVAEKIAPSASFRDQPELTLVPHFLVEAISVVENAGWPGSCWPHYEVDYPAVEAYMNEAESVLKAHLDAAPEAREAAHA